MSNYGNKMAMETKETGTTQKMKPETSRQQNNKIRGLEHRHRGIVTVAG